MRVSIPHIHILKQAKAALMHLNPHIHSTYLHWPEDFPGFYLLSPQELLLCTGLFSLLRLSVTRDILLVKKQKLLQNSFIAI